MDLFKSKYFYYYGNDDAISRGLSAVFLEKKNAFNWYRSIFIWYKTTVFFFLLFKLFEYLIIIINDILLNFG